MLVLPQELHQGLGQTLYRRKAVQSNKLGDYRLYLAKIWPIEEAETYHYWEKGIDMIMAKVFSRSHHELLIKLETTETLDRVYLRQIVTRHPHVSTFSLHKDQFRNSYIETHFIRTK